MGSATAAARAWSSLSSRRRKPRQESGVPAPDEAPVGLELDGPLKGLLGELPVEFVVAVKGALDGVGRGDGIVENEDLIELGPDPGEGDLGVQ